MIPFLLLKREDGREAVVRADEIGVVLTDSWKPKESPPTDPRLPALTLLLRNNTTVKVIETNRSELFARISSALGRQAVVIGSDGKVVS